MSLLGGQLEPKISQFPVEELVIEVDDSIESDLLGIDRNLAIHGKVSQKRLHLCRPALGGVTLPDEVDVLSDPPHIRLLGFNTIAAQAHIGPQSLQEGAGQMNLLVR